MTETAYRTHRNLMALVALLLIIANAIVWRGILAP